jgi:hypothetical protein
MVSKQHCSICGFVMLSEVKGDQVVYSCSNRHPAQGESVGMYMAPSDNVIQAKVFKSLDY